MGGALVLGVASLYWASPVLIPVALSILLAFLLSPIDNALRRRGLGRGLSVALLAVLALVVVAAISWGTSIELKDFFHNLPGYQGNIKKRIADLQIGPGTALDKVRIEFAQLMREVTTNTAAPEAAQPILVTVRGDRFTGGMWQFSPVVRPLLESVSYIMFVGMMAAFMLLERDELRNRAVRLLGYGRLSLTTQALDEAGQRVSRYLFAQFVVNVCLGVVIGLGLLLLGVPYALLWGFLVILLRFIPYIGIWIAAILPLAVSLATSSNWWQPLSVLGLFALLEPIVALLVEPMVFSQSAGTSKVAMLISIAFWTWLWGPVGLLLATPLTACLAVMAKYVPQLEFISMLLGDEPIMQASVAYYERLVAGDQDEAEMIVDEQLRLHPVEHVFDEVLIPALHYAKRDSRLGILAADDLKFIYDSTREIIERIHLPAATSSVSTGVDLDTRTRILVWPARDEADALALLMLQQLLDPAHYTMEICAPGKRLAEIVPEVEQKKHALFCIGFITPGGLSASRHLTKLLRSRFPELKIVAGRWGLHDNLPQDREILLSAGATHVAGTLIETRDRIVHALSPEAKRDS